MSETFLFIPSCTGPLHAGHQFNLLCNLSLYEKSSATAKRFITLIDNAQGPRVDEEEALANVVDLLPPEGEIVQLVNEEAQHSMPEEPAGSPLSASPMWVMWQKLAFFSRHNVKQLARGNDLRYHHKWEQDLVRCYTPWLGVPKMHFHPHIVDGNGKLSASSGVDYFYTHDDLALAARDWNMNLLPLNLPFPDITIRKS